MKPRVERPSWHERAGRERKMAVLVPAVEALASATGRDPVDLAEHLTADEWAVLAAKESLDRDEKINPPSGTTITLMIGALRERSRRSA